MAGFVIIVLWLALGTWAASISYAALRAEYYMLPPQGDAYFFAFVVLCGPVAFVGNWITGMYGHGVRVPTWDDFFDDDVDKYFKPYWEGRTK